jgi:hypothetical protein
LESKVLADLVLVVQVGFMSSGKRRLQVGRIQLHNQVSPHRFELSGLATYSVRDQMLRAMFVLEPMFQSDLIGKGKPLLIAGSGPAGIDPHGRLYYSCRYVTSPQAFPIGPANTVVVYDLDSGVNFSTLPLLTSTDPTFVQSICN